MAGELNDLIQFATAHTFDTATILPTACAQSLKPLLLLLLIMYAEIHRAVLKKHTEMFEHVECVAWKRKIALRQARKKVKVMTAQIDVLIKRAKRFYRTSRTRKCALAGM